VSYTIEWKPSARKEIRKLDPTVRRGVIEAVTAFGVEPRPPGSVTLTGSPGGDASASVATASSMTLATTICRPRTSSRVPRQRLPTPGRVARPPARWAIGQPFRPSLCRRDAEPCRLKRTSRLTLVRCVVPARAPRQVRAWNARRKPPCGGSARPSRGAGRSTARS